MDRELDHYDTDMVELQRVVENVDNQSRKNNEKLKGHKEGPEGQDLKRDLEELFLGCADSDYSKEIKIVNCYIQT